MAARRRRRDTDPKKVVGYVRVSTDEQALGPEAQRNALEAWCRAQEAVQVAVCEDIEVSGATPLEKRPGLNQALDTLTAEGNNVDGDILGFGYSRKSSHGGIRPKTDKTSSAGSRERPERGLNGSARS